MSEIYWLTRLDYLIGVSIAITVVAAILLIAFGMMEIVDGDDEIIMSSVKRKAILRISGIALAISTVVWVFIPSSKEAMMIWGIGQTLDCIQENEYIKELPDKCVKALENWVDSLIEEERE